MPRDPIFQQTFYSVHYAKKDKLSIPGSVLSSGIRNSVCLGFLLFFVCFLFSNILFIQDLGKRGFFSVCISWEKGSPRFHFVVSL